MLKNKRGAILSIRIPKEIKEFFSTMASRKGVTLSDTINQILNEEYENYNKGE